MVKIQQKYFFLFKEGKIYCYGHGSKDEFSRLWLPDCAPRLLQLQSFIKAKIILRREEMSVTSVP